MAGGEILLYILDKTNPRSAGGDGQAPEVATALATAPQGNTRECGFFGASEGCIRRYWHGPRGARAHGPLRTRRPSSFFDAAHPKLQ